MALWESINIDNGTDDFTYNDVEGFEVTPDGNRVELASGISKRRDVIYGLGGTIWEADAYTEILPFMEANDDLTITITMDDGKEYEFASCRGLFTPVLSPVGDISSVYIDAANTGDDPGSDADDSWTELGTTVGVSQPECTANAVDLGEGNRQEYSDARVVHDMEIAGDVQSDITEGRHDIAIEHPDGGYRVYRNVWVDEAVFVPRPQTQQIDVTMLHLEGAAGTFGDVLEFPSAPEDLFYGIEFEITNYGYETANVLTVTPAP